METRRERFLMPEEYRRLGRALEHARETKLHDSLRATSVMANQVVDNLSRIWNAAEFRGQLPEASSPCRLVVRNRECGHERFLSEEEFRCLGRTLAEAEIRKGVAVLAVAAIRMLPTGCLKKS